MEIRCFLFSVFKDLLLVLLLAFTGFGRLGVLDFDINSRLASGLFLFVNLDSFFSLAFLGLVSSFAFPLVHLLSYLIRFSTGLFVSSRLDLLLATCWAFLLFPHRTPMRRSRFDRIFSYPLSQQKLLPCLTYSWSVCSRLILVGANMVATLLPNRRLSFECLMTRCLKCQVDAALASKIRV